VKQLGPQPFQLPRSNPKLFHHPEMKLTELWMQKTRGSGLLPPVKLIAKIFE